MKNTDWLLRQYNIEKRRIGKPGWYDMPEFKAALTRLYRYAALLHAAGIEVS